MNSADVTAILKANHLHLLGRESATVDAYDRTIASAFFTYKDRLYLASRFDGKKLVIDIVGASGMSHFVGYGPDCSELLHRAAVNAIWYADRCCDVLAKAVRDAAYAAAMSSYRSAKK